MPNRIVLDARWVFRELSGIGRYTLELLRAMAADGEEFEFVVLVRDAERRASIAQAAGLEGDARFSFAELPYGPFSLRGQFAAARLLQERGAGVYHSTNFMIPLPAFPRRRPHAVKCVCNIHDLIPLAHPEFTPRALKTRLFPVYRALMGEIARRTDAVVTGSLHAKSEMTRLLGLPPERVTAVPDGVDGRYVPAPATAVRPSVTTGVKTILYVGRCDPYKNLTGLVEAFALLVKRDGVNARLEIIGPPDARYPEAPAAVRLHGLEERVHWRGYVDDAALLKAYQDADALALLSRCEGFGLPVAEAMACGTPVVCSNAASLPEVAGDAARLVNPDDPSAAADALRSILTDPAAAAALRAAGLERARRFSWKAAAAAVRDVYRQVATS